ncbi:MAG TPA: CBS domain-containing protein [Micromonosporaceae bacterium]
MRARDIMTRPVYTVRADDPVERAAAVLVERGITAAPVVDDRGDLVGIVSEADVLWQRSTTVSPAGPVRTTARAVRDVMTKDVVTLPSDADIGDVAETLLDLDVHSVPIVDDDELVGIVSRRDIVHSVVRDDDVLAQEVQHRLDEYAGGRRRWTATVDQAVVTIGGRFDDEAERHVVVILARSVPGVAEARIAQ